MDWSRAKTILIVAFIILDLFLAAQLNQMMQQKSQVVDTYNITDQQLQYLLTSSKITFNFQNKPKISQLNLYKATISPLANWKRDERGAYTKSFASIPLSFSNEQDLERILNEQLSFFKDYKRVSTTHNKIIYVQMINGRPIFDSKLEVTLKNKNQIESIQVIHFKIVEKPTLLNLIPFNSVLYQLITSLTDSPMKNKTISVVALGYRSKPYPNAADQFILVPYWRFNVNKESFDVNATKRDSNFNVEHIPSDSLNEHKGKK